MWKYKNQIKLRWISFILGILLLIFFLIHSGLDQSLTKTGMKVIITKLQVNFEMLPIWNHIIIILTSILGLLYGLPTVCIVLPLMLLKNCTFAFIVGSACQITTTLIAMWMSYNFGKESIPSNLRKKLEKNKDEFQSFAFWSRIYYNVPLRTIDKLTPFVHNNKESYFSTLIAASCAILIRVLIPTMALKHIIDQFTLLEPNPALENDKLILWAIILIAYTLLPKMPEIMICPDKVKHVLLEIENPSIEKIRIPEPQKQPSANEQPQKQEANDQSHI